MVRAKKASAPAGNVTMKMTADIGESWERMGVEIGFNPAPLSRCRFFIFGPVKNGKTTLAASFPRALHLDFEDAARNVVGARAHRIYVSGMEQLDKIIEKLETENLQKNRTFDTVIFDTGDRLQDLLYAGFEDRHGTDLEHYRGGQSGWKQLSLDFLSYPRRVYKASYGWVTAGHIRYTEVADKGGNKLSITKAGVTPLITAGLQQDADYLLQVGVEVTKEEVADPRNPKMKKSVPVRKTWLTTREGGARDMNAELGTRVPLSEFIELPKVGGFDAIEADWKSVVVRLQKEDEQLRST